MNCCFVVLVTLKRKLFTYKRFWAGVWKFYDKQIRGKLLYGKKEVLLNLVPSRISMVSLCFTCFWEVSRNCSALITFVFPRYYQVTSNFASFKTKHSQAKGWQSLLIKHALLLFEMVLCLTWYSPSHNLRLENLYSHCKNYCLQSEVCSEKNENVCLIGLLDENEK